MFIRTLLFAAFLIGTLAEKSIVQELCELNGTPEKVTEIENSLDLKTKQRKIYNVTGNPSGIDTIQEFCQNSANVKELRRAARNAYGQCLNQKVRDYLEEGNNADDRLIDFICSDKSTEVLGAEWEGIFEKVQTTFTECGPINKAPENNLGDLLVITLTGNCEKFDTFTSCVKNGYKDYGNADVVNFVKSMIEHLRATMPC